MTNLDRILKSRDITLPTKVGPYCQSYGFSVVLQGGEKEEIRTHHHSFPSQISEQEGEGEKTGDFQAQKNLPVFDIHK